jgi:hypothetical protein
MLFDEIYIFSHVLSGGMAPCLDFWWKSLAGDEWVAPSAVHVLYEDL